MISRGAGNRKRATGWRRDSIEEITRRLDELLRQMGDPAEPANGSSRLDETSLEAARQVWRASRERNRIFGPALSTDPGWDILLDLYIAMGEEREATIATITASTGIPEPTVLRCIAHLVDTRLVTRRAHPFEAQATSLALTDRAMAMMSEYLARTRELGAAAA